MKTPYEATKDFLKEQLKRTDIPKEYRSSIASVLNGLDKDKQKSEQIWNDFIEMLKTRLSDWKEKYPVNDFKYELDASSTGHFRSVTLHLNGKRYSTWIFEVSSFLRPQHEVYFSSIDSTMDELKISSFDEILPLIEQTFNSNCFKEIIEKLNE